MMIIWCVDNKLLLLASRTVTCQAQAKARAQCPLYANSTSKQMVILVIYLSVDKMNILEYQHT